MNPAIEVEALVKRYGSRTVVDGVNFTVHAGQVLALLGRNGAGKTTTMECIEGFRSPDQGRVRILGADPASQRHQVAERIGVMLQDGGAYPASSPREMLRLYRRLFAQPRDADELLELTGLTAVADARFRTLSGGEKQRVNLALALAGSPEVLFLDEPTAGMDTAARHDTWDLISQLRSGGTAILLTTHYLEEAERLADELLILHQGRIVAAGEPAQITGGSEQVLITTAGAPPAEQLTQILGTAVVSPGPGRYVVAAGPDAIASLTAALAGAGIALTGVTTQQRSLEEVFLSLTGGGA